MAKYKVQMINKYTDVVEEDYVDDMIFDDEEEAEDYASYCNSCASEGAEILQMSNPGDYEEDYGDEEAYEYIATEIE